MQNIDDSARAVAHFPARSVHISFKKLDPQTAKRQSASILRSSSNLQITVPNKKTCGLGIQRTDVNANVPSSKHRDRLKDDFMRSHEVNSPSINSFETFIRRQSDCNSPNAYNPPTQTFIDWVSDQNSPNAYEPPFLPVEKASLTTSLFEPEASRTKVQPFVVLPKPKIPARPQNPAPVIIISSPCVIDLTSPTNDDEADSFPSNRNDLDSGHSPASSDSDLDDYALRLLDSFDTDNCPTEPTQKDDNLEECAVNILDSFETYMSHPYADVSTPAENTNSPQVRSPASGIHPLNSGPVNAVNEHEESRSLISGPEYSPSSPPYNGFEDSHMPSNETNGNFPPLFSYLSPEQHITYSPSSPRFDRSDKTPPPAEVEVIESASMSESECATVMAVSTRPSDGSESNVLVIDEDCYNTDGPHTPRGSSCWTSSDDFTKVINYSPSSPSYHGSDGTPPRDEIACEAHKTYRSFYVCTPTFDANDSPTNDHEASSSALKECKTVSTQTMIHLSPLAGTALDLCERPSSSSSCYASDATWPSTSSFGSTCPSPSSPESPYSPGLFDPPDSPNAPYSPSKFVPLRLSPPPLRSPHRCQEIRRKRKHKKKRQ